MVSDPANDEIVFVAEDRPRGREAQLVLAAVGIDSQLVYLDERWSISVAKIDAADSRRELDDYHRELESQASKPTSKIPVYDFAFWAAGGYAIVILLIGILDDRWQQALRESGRMLAGEVIGGEAWRVVTALTLHADLEHLASNLAFGVLFGVLAGRAFGGGVAWFGIVIGGALGNTLNALIQPAEHASIGASTAVFATLGMLVAHGLHWWNTPGESKLKRYRPLIGGVLLLALTGLGGERTDVAAHVTGFLSGLMVGVIACRIPDRWLAESRWQIRSGAAALAIVIACWLIALFADVRG